MSAEAERAPAETMALVAEQLKAAYAAVRQASVEIEAARGRRERAVTSAKQLEARLRNLLGAPKEDR